jgi:hypothetical protein
VSNPALITLLIGTTFLSISRDQRFNKTGSYYWTACGLSFDGEREQNQTKTDNMKKRPETLESMYSLMEFIKAKFPFRPFSFDELKEEAAKHGASFQYLAVGGFLTRKSHGIYQLNRDLNLTAAQVHQKACVILSNNRKENLKLKAESKEKGIGITVEQRPDPGIQLKHDDTLWLTEDKAIAFLKDLGYRIQKRVTEFQEV